MNFKNSLTVDFNSVKTLWMYGWEGQEVKERKRKLNRRGNLENNKKKQKEKGSRFFFTS